MVQLSKKQIKDGVKTYQEFVKEQNDKISLSLIDLLKKKPEGFSVEEITKAVERSGVDLEITPSVKSKRAPPLMQQVTERLEDMSYYGIMESDFTEKGKRKYSLKQEYFQEGE
ncbi:MAG: hypothetical protein ACFFC6_07070 [Promethearchaeota archaeon]